MYKVMVRVELLTLLIKPVKNFRIQLFRCLTLILRQCAAPLALARAVLFWDCVGFWFLWRSVVQKHSPLTMFGLELPVFPSLSSLCRKRRGAPSALSGSERIDALRYQRIKKAKKMMMNNNNSKTRKKAGVNAIPVCFHTGKIMFHFLLISVPSKSAIDWFRQWTFFLLSIDISDAGYTVHERDGVNVLSFLSVMYCNLLVFTQ